MHVVIGTLSVNLLDRRGAWERCKSMDRGAEHDLTL